MLTGISPRHTTNRSLFFVCLLGSLLLCGIIGVYGNINKSIGLMVLNNPRSKATSKF